MRIELGNHGPLDKGQPLPFQAVTYVEVAPNTPLIEAFRAVTDTGAVGEGLWTSHSTEPPAWVVVVPDNSSPDDDQAIVDARAKAAEALATLLSAHYGCPVGEPSDLEEKYFTRNGPPGTGPAPSEES